MPLAPGQVLNNRYRIVRLLGQGGFGSIYRVWDLRLDGPRALKVNNLDTQAAQDQFARESAILADLRHPNLPAVSDYFILPGQGQYLVMEFVEGQDLQERLEATGVPLTEAQALPWIEQVCDALAYLHAQTPPIIHRDVKPANIRITPDGQVKLVDFGIAKYYDPDLHTTPGARAVTAGYSPPEQYGQGLTDPRSDLYALGATLYTLFTCCVPVESAQRLTGAALPAPRSLNPAVTPRTERAILKAMALAPGDRFQSAAELKDALQPPPVTPLQADSDLLLEGVESAVDQTVALPGEPAPPASARPRRASPRLMAMLLLGLLACAGLVCGSLTGWGAFQFLPGLLSPPSETPTRSAPTPLPPGPSATARPPASPTAQPPSATPLAPTQTTRPTRTPAPADPFPTYAACTGGAYSRLHTGDRAYVSYDPPKRNNVRSQPGTGASVTGQLQTGESVEILEGPRCADGFVWWRVRSLSRSLSGWTAEGDAAGFWLVPES